MAHDERVQYKFMIPASLKKRIEDAAHDNRRSLSAEIVTALEEKYPAPFEPDEDLMLACAAAITFAPERVGEQFRDDYKDLTRYMQEVHRIDDPERFIASYMHDLVAFREMSLERLFEWLQKVFRPWAAARRAQPEEFRSPSIGRKPRIVGNPDSNHVIPCPAEPTTEELQSARRLLRAHPDRELAREFHSKLAKAIAENRPKAEIVAQIHEWLGDEDPDQEYEPA
ncbi:hypothetical protein [Salipiger bermudensis]|uniref:hypothetical protein n=1 Tax=Salipiger bermudensis TaxID=344736 RepID=UPI001CD6EDD6|nr:hypothetical protein [Salipiger bermudensis]MCA0961151.1 hypothetical protein [Salipiger bermudensis]